MIGFLCHLLCSVLGNSSLYSEASTEKVKSPSHSTENPHLAPSPATCGPPRVQCALAVLERLDAGAAPVCAAATVAEPGRARSVHFILCFAELEGNGLAEQDEKSSLPNYLQPLPVASTCKPSPQLVQSVSWG